jgi:hypothetical protein
MQSCCDVVRVVSSLVPAQCMEVLIQHGAHSACLSAVQQSCCAAAVGLVPETHASLLVALACMWGVLRDRGD